jgi:prepilin-type N-terminal cleavage/methylation domain-containing protein
MNNKGFTLIEMMVVVAVFTLLVTAGTGVFISSLKGQKQSLAVQEVLDQSSYLMEYISRALRMAKKDLDGACTGATKVNYVFESQCLKFKNYHSECQQFCLDGTRLRDQDGNYLTADNLSVSSFKVFLVGEQQPPTDYLQPKVTVFLKIEGREESSVEIQSTVSQRNLDIRR